MKAKTLQQVLSPFRVCILLLAIFFAPLCGWFFRCGCTFLWSGASAHCSVFDPARADCPWCVMPFGSKSGNRFGVFLQTLPFFLISFALLGVSRLTTRFSGENYWRQLFLLLTEMLLLALVIAWLYAKLLNYPLFLF
jgi:hypothetical protein